MKKKIISFFLCLTIAFALFTPIYSAGYSVSVSTTSVQPNGSFTVTVSIPQASGMVYFKGTNATVSSSSMYCDTSCSITATAGSSGTASVTVTSGAENTPNEVTDINGTFVAIERTVSVSIISSSSPSGNTGGGSGSGSSSSSGSGSSATTPVVDNRSSNNNLASLSISEGQLSPAFSSDVTEYSVELASSVSSITVNASASDSKASVSGTGEISLNAGDNRIEITVTAENGNPKLYVINAYVDETPLIYVPYGNDELGVVRNLSAVQLDGFEETTVQIDGNEVKAWRSPTRNITVVYLQKDDEKNFYIYDETKGVTSIYRQVALLGNTLGLVDIPEELQERAGMVYQELTIDDVTLMGWVYEDKSFSNYSLIYAMDDMGEYRYYQYESTQNTLQLYSGAAAVTQEDYENLVNQNASMQLYFYIALGGCVVLLLTTIYGLVSVSRYKKRLLSKGNEINDMNKAD